MTALGDKYCVAKHLLSAGLGNPALPCSLRYSNELPAAITLNVAASSIVSSPLTARSPKKYARPPGSDDFRAEIFQPRASGKTSSVARDTRPIGTYILNILPFAAMPAAVSRVCVSGTLETISKVVPLNELGTVMLRGGELWSFSPAVLVNTVLKPVMSESSVRMTAREELERDPDLARGVSWLLRKHFEGRLRSLRAQGLMIEQDRPSNRRAYFFGERGGPRLMIYNTPSRHGIAREVVKQRGEAPRVWFENEGIGYEIARLPVFHWK